jgi:predicted metal-binding membrane protein
LIEVYSAVRDRVTSIAPAAVLVSVAAGCWAITAHRMQGMDMGPGTALGGLGWFAGVWAAMMAAMMLPSLAPMALAYAGASRRRGSSTPTGASRQGASTPTVASGVFALGYLLTWLGAGVLAYGVFDGVRSLHLSWLSWHSAGPYVAGGVIVAAALYELTPTKSTCLRHCRNPQLVAGRWRPGLPGALRVGLEHGGFCVGASWALMAALFALGVMSVTWMIVVTALVALEKLLPWDKVAIGATMVFIGVLGLAVAFAPNQVPGLTIPH